MALVGASQELRGPLAAGGVHAHVQRPVETEAEATRGIVDPYDDCKRDRFRSVGALPADIRANYPLAKENKARADAAEANEQLAKLKSKLEK